jgi:hypothetical protein
MFLTLPRKRHLLNEAFWRERLPTRSSHSLAALGRFGSAFVRMVREQCPQFQGLPTQNDLVTLLRGQNVDPTLGMGRILIDEYDIPVCHVYLHVDDILVNSPNCDKTCAALLDCTSRVGLIFQPVKTKHHSEIQNKCWCIYDCTGINTISIPQDKLTRERSQIQLVKSYQQVDLSRLALSVPLELYNPSYPPPQAPPEPPSCRTCILTFI